MKRNHLLTLTILAIAFALPIVAQAQQKTLQYFRPYDQRGVNVFETTKDPGVAYEGFEIYWGGAFTQQFQSVNHDNENPGENPDNELVDIGGGFNLATANLLLGVQLAEGIQINLNTYLSSQHHPESWVKGGFLQVDKFPMINSDRLDNIMDFVTLRIGHMEINYGDAHFRRTDNGMAMYNEFVGNMIMDSFTTEIGGEVYVQKDGILGMIGVTDGEVRGRVDRPDDRAPSIYGKLAFDRELQDDLRVRLSGSFYTTSGSVFANNLYGGDRAGTRFYDVLVNGSGDSFTNGRINPRFAQQDAFQVNPFVQFKNFEVHGLFETVTGDDDKGGPEYTYDQYAVDGLVRFLKDRSAYVGFRWNTVEGEAGFGDFSSDRVQVAAGWFATPNILLKINYVDQQFDDYPTTSILHEGSFDGITIEGVVAF